MREDFGWAEMPWMRLHGERVDLMRCCDVCGKDCADDMRFCPSCGGELVSPAGFIDIDEVTFWNSSANIKPELYKVRGLILHDPWE